MNSAATPQDPKPQVNSAVSTTLSITPGAVQQLQALTGEKDTGKALNQVLETVVYLKRQVEQGNKILIAKKDGSVQNLSFNN